MAKKKKKTKITMLRGDADRHLLYQAAVQNVDHEEEFVSDTFKKIRGRKGMTMREDFCGTALAAAEWVKNDPERRVLGLDLDQPTLDWGQKHNIDPLGDAAKQVEMRNANVLTVTDEKFDVCCAMNFSYFIFRTRHALTEYHRAVHASLNDEGVFFMDIYGGTEAQETLEEKRKIDGFDGIKYIWEQAESNPIDSGIVNHIHFQFKNGERWDRAFTYEWRLWQPVEVIESLLDAGFKKADLYWELEDEDEEGTGEYVPMKVVENQAGWIAYIVAEK